MTALRSRRLEGIFGSPFDQITYAQVESLVTSQVAESFDLDFKETLYEGNDQGKRACGGDVAAMANTAGGVVVLGVSEDDQSRAASVPGVTITDAEIRRILATVNSQVAPAPQFDIIPIAESPERPDHGVLLIAVPNSPMAPHGVLVNEGMRYPRRNGSTTRYLSEPEVAEGYRRRFVGIQDRAEMLSNVEDEHLLRLDGTSQTFLVVSMVPDIPGEFTIDAQSYNEFQQQVIGKSPWIIGGGRGFLRARVSTGRLLATGSPNTELAEWASCDLHEDGAGSFAGVVDVRGARQAQTGQVEEDPPAQINIVVLLENLMSGLRFLGRHARDRAAAGGMASVQATIWPVTGKAPAELISNLMFRDLGDQRLTVPPTASGLFDIDDLAEVGAPLVAAAHRLGTRLAQAFGCADVLQMTSDGAICLPGAWGQEEKRIEQWANSAGIEIRRPSNA